MMRNLISFFIVLSCFVVLAAAALKPRTIPSSSTIQQCFGQYSNSIDLVGKSGSKYHYFGKATFSVKDGTGNKGPYLSFDTLDLTPVFLDPQNGCTCFDTVADNVKTYGYTGGDCNFGISELSIQIGHALPENYLDSGFSP